MPNRNGRGPLNEGPMTGRGMGPCNPANTNAPQQPIGFGRGGFGRGMGGFGRGMRGFGRGIGMYGYAAAPTTSLQEQKQVLEAQLAAINTQLQQEEAAE